MQKKLTKTVDGDFYSAYAQMAEDEKREAEALEWAEMTFGDMAEIEKRMELPINPWIKSNAYKQK